MASKRSQIIAALVARLKAIKKVNGYETDAGLRVQYGPLPVAPSDPLPCVALESGDVADNDELLDGVSERRRWPFAASGRIAADLEDPLQLPGEALLGDLKKAIFQAADRTLGGLVQDVERAPGESVAERIEGGNVDGCLLPFVVVFAEEYGAP